jgi:hypothetical protein
MRRTRGTWQRLTERTELALVVAADAFEREIEPIRDPRVEPTGAVDGLFAIDPDPRKDHHAADREVDGHERFVLFRGEELGMRRSESHLVNEGITESLASENSPRFER